MSDEMERQERNSRSCGRIFGFPKSPQNAQAADDQRRIRPTQTDGPVHRYSTSRLQGAGDRRGIKYIDSLHLALFHRLRAQDPRTGGLTADDNTMDQSQLRQWIGQMLPAEAAQFLAQHLQHREKTNKWPTFLDKVDRMVRKKNS